MNEQSDADIIIVGAGFVGLMLSFALAQQGRRIIVVEAKDLVEKKQQQLQDARALALSIKSQHILATLNIWPHIENNATPISQVEVSEQGSFGKLRLDAKSQHVSALGFVLPAQQLGTQLLHLCQQEKNITWFTKTQIDKCVQDNNGVRVTLSDDTTLSASLLILAEGSQSKTRESFHFAQSERNYHQFAMVANVSLTHAPVNTAYQRFTRSGTLALLPLSKGRFTLVVTVADNDYPKWQAFNDAEFLQKAQQMLGSKLGTLHELGIRQSYPLQALFVEQAYHNRLLLMGNAAHTLNPIAAQGLNLTLRDIALLVELIAEADLQNHFAVFDLLTQYQAKRLPDQKNMLHFTDNLVDILGVQVLKPLRSLGLVSLDTVPFLKRRLFGHLLGY
jgi:2-octaprenyl-6-methoxyphenol hydroxylase